MSHIEEMIRELCPNGVEYKKLKNTTTITRGVRVVKSQLQSIGSYPVYQNSLTPMGYYDKYNCSANTTFIIGAGSAGEMDIVLLTFGLLMIAFSLCVQIIYKAGFFILCCLVNKTLFDLKLEKPVFHDWGERLLKTLRFPFRLLRFRTKS